jgi:hypothetical protein
MKFRFTTFGAAIAAGGLMLSGAQEAAALRVAKPAVAVAQADSAEGLKALCTSILAAYKADDQAKSGAMVKALALPNHEAWFKKTFGDELGAKAADEYAKMLPSLEPEVGKLFADLVKKGKTEINRVSRITAENAEAEATGAQKTALSLMAEKTPLYTVSFVEPGKASGTTLWSFVYAENGFRLIGKMRSVSRK